jgi:hypothetical protein
MEEKFVNQLKKGDWVLLRNGWYAQMVTVRGNTPIADVYGFEHEMGSVYAHDIAYQVDGNGGKIIARIIYTPAQKKLRTMVSRY